MAKTSSAVKRRYNEKTYDRIGITVPKGRKDDIEAVAGPGKVNHFVNELLRNRLGMTKEAWGYKPERGTRNDSDE